MAWHQSDMDKVHLQHELELSRAAPSPPIAGCQPSRRYSRYGMVRSLAPRPIYRQTLNLPPTLPRTLALRLQQ